MSWFKRANRRRGVKYVLKARRREGNRSVWEDIAEFDQQVGVMDVKDLIEAYLEDGYDAFRLEEVNEEGKRVRLCWTKYYKGVQKKKDPVEQLNQLQQVVQQSMSAMMNATTQMINTLNQAISMFSNTINTIMSRFQGGERISLAELLAEHLYTEQLINKILAMKGLKQGGSSGSELDELLKFLNALRMVQLGGLATAAPIMMPSQIMTPQPQVQQPQPQPQQAAPQMIPQQMPQPQASSPGIEIEEDLEDLEKLKKKAKSIAEQIIEEARKKTAEEIAPCKALGEC